MGIVQRLSFKDQAFQLREAAVLDATTRILASRGFDLMTMDEVAAEAGISKPVLYKHFDSKEKLAVAAMIRLLGDAIAVLDDQAADTPPRAQLQALLAWAVRLRLSGGMPLLPSTQSHVRGMLTRSLSYVAVAVRLHNRVKKLIKDARRQGQLQSALSDDTIAFSFYSRTCDPAVDYLRTYAKMSDDLIVEQLVAVYFCGIGAPALTEAPTRKRP